MKTSIPSYSFFLSLASIFIVSMGYGIVLPVLPFFLESLLETGTRSISWHTGMLTGIYMLTLFIGAPFLGRFSDKVGRRLIILIGLGGFILSLAAFGFSKTLGMAYLTRGLGGLFAAAVSPVALAYVSETALEQQRARRFAWMSTASILGFLIGPMLSGGHSLGC